MKESYEERLAIGFGLLTSPGRGAGTSEGPADCMVCAIKPTWAARKSRDLKFTAPLHHINVELLTSSFYQLKKKAAVGVDQGSVPF